MSRDYLEIGSVPADEACEQLGPNYDPRKAKAEGRAYIEQLRRVFGREPRGARLILKANPHDFGTYHEVVCEYDDEDREAYDYALKIEANSPATWDLEAKRALGLAPPPAMVPNRGQTVERYCIHCNKLPVGHPNRLTHLHRYRPE